MDAEAKEDDKSGQILEGEAILNYSDEFGVFYNPVQVFNRDITVLVLQQFITDLKLSRDSLKTSIDLCKEEPSLKRSKINADEEFEVRILDALSASGIRAIRFAKEVPYVTEIIANDFSKDAGKLIKKNIENNDVSDIVQYSFSDAKTVLMEHRAKENRFLAIDLDPYGSASHFLSDAVQAVADKGILMVTCTDMAVLCGNAPEACYNKYGSIGLRHKCCHEFAIRILLRAIDLHAGVYGQYIRPLLSISVDFYVRIFVQVMRGAKAAKNNAVKHCHVLACTGCHTFSLHPLLRKVEENNSLKYTASVLNSDLLTSNSKCVHCKHSLHIAGPIYSSAIHDVEFVNNLINRLKNIPPESCKFQTYSRLLGVLTVISEELIDIPLYYELDQLMHVVKGPVPRASDFKSAILNAGYRTSISHCNPRAIKTDAPSNLIWDIVRTVAANSNILSSKLAEGSPGRAILQMDVTHRIEFTSHPLARAESKTNRLLRFQNNKGKSWGPKARAKVSKECS